MRLEWALSCGAWAKGASSLLTVDMPALRVRYVEQVDGAEAPRVRVMVNRGRRVFCGWVRLRSYRSAVRVVENENLICHSALPLGAGLFRGITRLTHLGVVGYAGRAMARTAQMVTANLQREACHERPRASLVAGRS